MVSDLGLLELISTVVQWILHLTCKLVNVSYLPSRHVIKFQSGIGLIMLLGVNKNTFARCNMMDMCHSFLGHNMKCWLVIIQEM